MPLHNESVPLPVDLSGRWTAILDPLGQGEREGWYTRDLSGAPGQTSVQLPGSVQSQGLGDRPDIATEWVGAAVDHPFFSDERYARYRTTENFSVPFFLQPERVYVGAVWYQRTVEVPERDMALDLRLELERVHWESTVWLDDDRVGSDRSLSAPHRFTLRDVRPGTHRLTIRVDNSMIVDVGTNAHSVSDHTQGGWNGIIGAMTLTPVAAARISTLSVHPDAEACTATVRMSLIADTLDGITGTLTVRAQPLDETMGVGPQSVVVDIDVPAERFRRGRGTSGTHLDVIVPLGGAARLWDEFDPALYDVTATLEATTEHGRSVDRRSTTFGLRTVSAVGTRIEVNGRPVFLRGALECCVFPLTGYPPTDRPSWSRLIETCQAYGLNHLRFHSWCPPRAAFEAADAAGMYLQIESPVWANQGAAIGEGRDVDAYILEETQRIIDEYGNHPSFLLMAHGNEPAGRDVQFLTNWVTQWRRRDPRRLYTTAGGWPSIPESDFDCIPEPRVQAWGEGLASRINATAPATVADYSDWVERTPRPIVTHEAGQWCVYPNLDEMSKYTGIMQPKNFGIARDFLADAGLLDQADDFLHASGRLQLLCYKEEMEAALRTPGFAGIQLLGLADFPGQGTAPIGVLDAFWEPKPYVDAAEYARFCASTVPLALLSRRVWTSADDLVAEVRIAHFGPAAMTAEVVWRLEADGGDILDSGTLPVSTVVIGNEAAYGTITAPLGHIDRAQHVRLVIAVQGESERFENDWDLWVYPVEPSGTAALPEAPSAGLLVTDDLDTALHALGQGGTVILSPRAESIHSPVEFGFSPVFWNTSWTNGQAPHTLGILCDPEHPAFSEFPTGTHTDWQWWELLHGAKTLDLTALGSSARPIVQVIDSWFDARRLALVVEARVGTGRLLLSTIDLLSDLGRRPVAAQLDRSLRRYLASEAFSPDLELTSTQLRAALAGSLD
ncbi:glycoside hydrolase [Plantibacter flavus]|uniref:sugar-binding domain-containing protein n=1 Tax=Plantibacter flavus TaxID=150123 RepID=UPI003F153338